MERHASHTDTHLMYSLYSAGILEFGQKHQSASTMWRPVTTHMGRASRVVGHSNCVNGIISLLTGHNDMSSGASSPCCDRRRTIASIFRFKLGSIALRCSGRINMTAYSYADALSPARWHSMTVDVKICTWWSGNFEMDCATRRSIRAAPVWSFALTNGLTRRYECSNTNA